MMKDRLVPPLKTDGLPPPATGHLRKLFSIPLALWLLLSFLGIATQIQWRRQLQPGEFALLNAALGAVTMALSPLAAMKLAVASFAWRPGVDEKSAAQIAETGPWLEQNFTLIWALGCLIFCLPIFAALGFPRFAIGLLALVTVLIGLGAGLSAAYYRKRGLSRHLMILLVVAASVRLAFACLVTTSEPWAETGLIGTSCAGLVLLGPVLRRKRMDLHWALVWTALKNREFRSYLGATLSVIVGISIFTSADRLISQFWFGRAADNNMGLVRWPVFDGYQTAGLVGRSLLWGTQPVLWLLFLRRAAAEKTSRANFQPLWIYLSALGLGGCALNLLVDPLASFFGGDSPAATAYYIPRFLTAMVPLALLQGVGVFALASRRLPECALFGAASMGYAILLIFEGKPSLMLTCMGAGGAVSLLLVLFLGVARWGRRQP